MIRLSKIPDDPFRDAFENMPRRTLKACFVIASIMALLTITKGSENPAMCFFWSHVPRVFQIITDLGVSNGVTMAQDRYCTAARIPLR